MRPSPISAILATTVFLSGASFASTAPYRAIVGVETLGLSNAIYALVMVLNALGGAAAALALGWFSDMVGDRRWLVLICAVVGGLGFGFIWAFQTPIAYIIAFCLLVPFGNALFSQSFSYSRAYYDKIDAKRSEFMMSILRSLFTVAWVVMPPLAGWIAAETSSFSVFGLAAAMHVGSTLLIGLLFAQPKARIGVPRHTGSIADAVDLPKATIAPGHRIGIVGVTLARVALQINMTVLPLIILRDLSGSLADVGINAAVAAAIEVPFMIGWGYLAMRMPKETILAISCAIFALYMVLMAVAQSVLQVLMLQGIAAIAIAALMSITISYLQEAIKGRVGLSTSLMDVTQVLSVMGASAVFALNPGALYAPLMGVAALLSIAAALLLIAAGRLARREIAAGATVD
ncbi:MFS transporter [Pelagibacterium halotolerans]|uniref:MFS transporter n=1 Tax=Pelagibacterium halotolerans TaxID=531813 RepID=UPI00384A6C68